MKISEQKNSITIYGVSDFDPVHTFMCGQCFRWDMQDDKSFVGVAGGKAVKLSLTGKDIHIDNITRAEYDLFWHSYLDLDTDYSQIKSELRFDKNVSEAMDFGWGIRILNQELFECLISFIISTQNAIPRIKKIVSALSESFGKKISYDGKDYYAFPTPNELCGIKEADLSHLRAGYRAKYIVDAVQKVNSGEVKLASLMDMSYADAKAELMKINGVGPKVADCVLLFSLKKKEAFPVDVWVKRTVRNLYLGEGANEKAIMQFASEHFGKYAGVAQQYLFYYARENKL